MYVECSRNEIVPFGRGGGVYRMFKWIFEKCIVRYNTIETKTGRVLLLSRVMLCKWRDARDVSICRKKDRLVSALVVRARLEAKSDIVHITIILTYISHAQIRTQRIFRSGNLRPRGWESNLLESRGPP